MGLSRMRILSVLMLATISVISAGATTVQYSDLNAWKAAVNVTGTINWETVLGGGYGMSHVFDGVLFENFRTSGPPTYGELFVVGNAPCTSTCLSWQFKYPDNDLVITLPNAVTAVSFYLGSQPDWGVFHQVLLPNGDVIDANSPAHQMTFVGFTSDTPFTTLTVKGTYYPWSVMDDFSYGDAKVPEPASMLLVGTGLAGLLGLLRCRK